MTIIAGADTLTLIGGILKKMGQGAGDEDVMKDVHELSDLHLPALLFSVASKGDQQRAKIKARLFVVEHSSNTATSLFRRSW